MSTSIQLTAETEKRLNLLVSQTGQDKKFCLQEIIEHGLEDMEDYYLATKIAERVRQGKEQVYSAHDVRKKLGLDS